MEELEKYLHKQFSGIVIDIYQIMHRCEIKEEDISYDEILSKTEERRILCCWC